jgi:hypothetical protein
MRLTTGSRGKPSGGRVCIAAGPDTGDQTSCKVPGHQTVRSCWRIPPGGDDASGLPLALLALIALPYGPLACSHGCRPRISNAPPRPPSKPGPLQSFVWRVHNRPARPSSAHPALGLGKTAREQYGVSPAIAAAANEPPSATRPGLGLGSFDHPARQDFRRFPAYRLALHPVKTRCGRRWRHPTKEGAFGCGRPNRGRKGFTTDGD